MKRFLSAIAVTVLFLLCEKMPLEPIRGSDAENSPVACVSSPTTFAKNYGGTGNESARSVIRTYDGGYALLGGDLEEKQFYLVKTDVYGNLQWEKRYGGGPDGPSGVGIGNCLRQTPDSGFIMIGTYTRYGPGAIIKVDKKGNVQWQQWLWEDDYLGANSIALSGDNGYAFVSYCYVGKFMVIVRKLAADGSILWVNQYETTLGALPTSIERTSDGGFIIAGKAIKDKNYGYHPEEDSGKNTDVYLLKINNQGKMQWQSTWGGPYTDEGLHAIQTSDGGFAVIGYNYKDRVMKTAQVYLIKTDSRGRYKFIKGYCPSAKAYGYRIVETSDNGFAFVGTAYSRASLIKVRSDGAYQWRKSFSRTVLSDALGLSKTSNGGYAVAGTVNTVSLNDQAALVKTDRNGNF